VDHAELRQHVLPALLIAFGVAACASASASPDPDAASSAATAETTTWDELDRRSKREIERPPALADGALLFENGVIMTVSGETLSPGWLFVREGRIAALGAGKAPGDLDTNEVEPTRIDLGGRTLTPGLIDAHSHLGVYPSPPLSANRDGNEMTSPNTAGVQAEHGFWPGDPGLVRALEGGVTTIHVLPGSGNLIGGRGVTLSLRLTRGARAMRFPGAPDSVKMACGENPKRVYGNKGSSPMTRMGNVRGYREAFAAAQRWRREQGKKPADEVTRDINLETLVGLLESRLLAQVHCYTAQDMLTFLSVAEEFGFRVRAFHHALEAYKVRDLLAERQIGVATWADWWGFKLEAWDTVDEAAALLAVSGVKVSIHSDSGEGIQRLNQEAAKALFSGLRAGLPLKREDALRWVTANPAWQLGIETEVGTLEVGKRADLVVWDQDPLSVYAKADLVWVGGELVIDRKAGKAPVVDFTVGLPPQHFGPSTGGTK
jgi:imidazolonepropionase-like amidohydrolase